jgi:hypothetical protein
MSVATRSRRAATRPTGRPRNDDATVERTALNRCRHCLDIVLAKHRLEHLVDAHPTIAPRSSDDRRAIAWNDPLVAAHFTPARATTAAVAREHGEPDHV